MKDASIVVKQTFTAKRTKKKVTSGTKGTIKALFMADNGTIKAGTVLFDGQLIATYLAKDEFAHLTCTDDMREVKIPWKCAHVKGLFTNRAKLGIAFDVKGTNSTQPTKVVEIKKGSGADQAGVKVGWVLRKINEVVLPLNCRPDKAVAEVTKLVEAKKDLVLVFKTN